MMRIIKVAVILFVSSSLLGCGSRLFTSRESNPVLEDYVGTWPDREVGTLATDAAHRVTVIRMANGQPENEYQWQKGEFCAEPPPDAMVNVAAAFGQAIAANIKIPDPKSGATMLDGSGQTEFYRTVATIMSPLLRRSQGLQWNRDNLSFVCNAYLNRIISKAEYKTIVESIMRDSQQLILKEIANLPKFDVTITGAPPASPAAPTPIILDSSVEAENGG